ncbi:YqcC family protein [Agarivorans sp. QJM3NY_29]|uniref:YqcC family protein n=1 Tax=unclassified Agarivorans TaxID=2636026 RepID=UPI003D7EE21A
MRFRIREQLFAIERCLKKNQCWQDLPPHPDLLQSTQPFCVDTLNLEQWLQFILLPRLHTLLDEGRPLPRRIAITPYAEEVLKHSPKDNRDLLLLLSLFDQSFNDD